MNLRWFYSRTVRQADQMLKHVHKIVSAQRDILNPDATQKVGESMADLRAAIRSNADKQALEKRMTDLENVANKWLKPYPNASLRENVEVLLVAIAVAMAIRTFFLQPFKIPTGSMQPTLFGITSNPEFSRMPAFPNEFAPQPDFEIPNPVTRFIQYWISGVQYKHVVARADGALAPSPEPQRFLLFNLRQQFYLEGDPNPYTVWFPPENLLRRAGLISYYGQRNPHVFKKGDDIIKMMAVSGDHLFVDRLTYNFRRPKRGEIIVFETKGIGGLPPDQFYIKRMVAMGGEHVRILNDRHLVIDGRRLDASTPHFEAVYSFDPAQTPQESQYSGHVNNFILPGLAPLFPEENHEYDVAPHHYMVMGDNTVNSSDSRTWGDFPEENVIGKSFFVYWPIGSQNGRTSRFGWGNR